MSGLPSRPSQARTRDTLQVVAAGLAAIAVGTYLTVHFTENKRKIAMDAIQGSSKFN
jgi:hypothetical protein